MVVFTNFKRFKTVEKHVCTLHAPNEKRRDDVILTRQEVRTRRHLANVQSGTGSVGI